MQLVHFSVLFSRYSRVGFLVFVSYGVANKGLKYWFCDMTPKGRDNGAKRNRPGNGSLTKYPRQRIRAQ
jgi:hypothetical protein